MEETEHTHDISDQHALEDRLLRADLRIRELEDAVDALLDDVVYLRFQLNEPSIVRRRGFYDLKSNDCIRHIGMSRVIPEMDDPTDLKTFEERVMYKRRCERNSHDDTHPAAVRAQGIADAVWARLRPFLDWFGKLRLDELWCNGRAWRHQNVPVSDAEFVGVEIDVGNCVHNRMDNTFKYRSDTKVDDRDDEAVANAVFREAADALCTRFGVTCDERAERNRRLACKRMTDRWWKEEEERMRTEDAG